MRRWRRAALLLALAAAAPAPAQVPSDTASVQAVVAAAREAATHDRNAESAALFGRAIAMDPARRGELLREYADQLTYSRRPDAAVPLYREVLAAGPAPGEARAARMGLALALAWSGRLRESQAEYQAVLGQEPGNLQARRELARVQSWRGRHREAARALAEFLREHPEDDEAALLLAQAQEGMGLRDRAAATLRALLLRRPGQGEAVRRLAALRAGSRPRTAIHQDASSQSDRLGIRRTSLEQQFSPWYGRAWVALRLEAQDYDPGRAGDPGVRVHRPGLGARYRFADWGEWNGHLHAERIGVRAAGPVETGGLVFRERTPATFDTWLTLWPGDAVRLDLGASRATFDNVRSLAGGVVADSRSLSADLLPDERTRFTARASQASYSDGNGRTWGQAEAEFRLLARPRVLVGGRSTAMRFARRFDHGYFNPRRYVSHVGTVRGSGALAGRGWYEVDAAAGHETVTPGGGKPLWSAGARAGWRLGERVELEGRVFHFSSAAASSGGFARTGGGATLRVAW